MKALAALWSLAALLFLAGAAALFTYGRMLADRIGEVNASDDTFWQLLNIFYTGIGALIGAGLLVVLIALCTHALLWARAESATPVPTSRQRRAIPSP